MELREQAVQVVLKVFKEILVHMEHQVQVERQELQEQVVPVELLVLLSGA